MIQGFEFEHGGRKFTCTTEAPWPTSTESWWWFRVSSEAHQRYAPFKACSSDTRASVTERIVKYHDDLRERRAAPSAPHWARRDSRPATPGKPSPRPGGRQP